MAETLAVLVGGLGTRLRAAVPDVPKPLAPVQGEPFLARLLRWAAAQDVTRALLLCGHGGEALQGFLRNWNAAGRVPRLDWTLEPAPLGTGGAVRFALDRLPEEFFLANGDSLCPLRLGELLAAHRAAKASLTMAAVHETDAASRGRLEIAEDGSVSGFAEKSGQGPAWVNAGVYRCRRDLFEALPEGEAVSLEYQLLPSWISAGIRVQAFRVDAPFLDIGTPLDWERAQREGWLP